MEICRYCIYIKRLLVEDFKAGYQGYCCLGTTIENVKPNSTWKNGFLTSPIKNGMDTCENFTAQKAELVGRYQW